MISSSTRAEAEFLAWRRIRAEFGVPSELSFAEWLADQPEEDQLDILTSLDPKMAASLRYSWGFFARDRQLPPIEPWDVWLILAGRGWGKTKCGSEMVIKWAREWPGTIIHLIGRTASDVRDVMIEGVSGILKCCTPDFRPTYLPSKTRIDFPNGSYTLSFASATPEEMRGPQAHKLWADEPATWLKQMETWETADFGIRLPPRFPGDRPQKIVTATPRPNKLIQMLVGLAEDLAEAEGRLTPEEVAERKIRRFDAPLQKPSLLVRMSKGSTYENRHNLAPTFFTNITAKYENTRVGLQELYAELLTDTPGALWKREWIDELRVAEIAEPFSRMCVAIDPSGSVGESANACGIVCVAQGARSDHAYILADASGVMTPAQWADLALDLCDQMDCHTIVAEKNFGGLMVDEVIRAAIGRKGMSHQVRVELVNASKGKGVRAEPVALLYEQRPGRVHHAGMFLELEDEMCTFDPSDSKAKSPNRLDALVWGIHYCARLSKDEPRLGIDYGIDVVKWDSPSAQLSSGLGREISF